MDEFLITVGVHTARQSAVGLLPTWQKTDCGFWLSECEANCGGNSPPD